MFRPPADRLRPAPAAVLGKNGGRSRGLLGGRQPARPARSALAGRAEQAQGPREEVERGRGSPGGGWWPNRRAAAKGSLRERGCVVRTVGRFQPLSKAAIVTIRPVLRYPTRCTWSIILRLGPRPVVFAGADGGCIHALPPGGARRLDPARVGLFPAPSVLPLPVSERWSAALPFVCCNSALLPTAPRLHHLLLFDSSSMAAEEALPPKWGRRAEIGPQVASGE